MVALLRAPTASDAIRLARSFEPDLMLLDLRLPDRSGLEVIRELNREISSGSFQVVVVTADKIATDHVKARALGVRDVLYKPIHVGQFLATVIDALANRRGMSGPAQGTPA